MQKSLVFLESKKEWGIAFAIFLLLGICMLAWRFYSFSEYIHKEKQTLQARVLNQYYKNDKWVLKLKSQGMILYATSRENLKDLQNREIRIFGKPAKCSFYESLKSCFFIIFSFDVLPRDYRFFFYDFIDSQHSSALLSKLYQTLFFATTLPLEWRDLASTLKISHLLAISGLHLGILLGFFYFLLSPIYRFFQARFFTYRNAFFDLSFLSSLLLFFYLILLDFPPSFLRAYVMSVAGFLFAYHYWSLLNFSFLLFCSCLILALFPHYVFSLGFWFSVCGVFYILLFFKHFDFSFSQNKILKALAITCSLNVVLFFNMLPLTDWFFPSFSPFSFLSIPLSIVFVPFFILILILHLFRMGGALDSILIKSLDFTPQIWQISTPAWLACFYVLLSLLAIKSPKAYFLALALSLAFCAFLLIKTLQ